MFSWWNSLRTWHTLSLLASITVTLYSQACLLQSESSEPSDAQITCPLTTINIRWKHFTDSVCSCVQFHKLAREHCSHWQEEGCQREGLTGNMRRRPGPSWPMWLKSVWPASSLSVSLHVRYFYCSETLLSDASGSSNFIYVTNPKLGIGEID